MNSLTQVIERPSFLRLALYADAVLSGVTGAAMIAGAGLFAGLLAVPEALLFEAGLVLVPYVAFVAWVASRNTIPTSAAKAIIVINVAWFVGSIGLLFTGWIAPNILGYAFIVFQAVVVGVLGEVQYFALRRAH